MNVVVLLLLNVLKITNGTLILVNVLVPSQKFLVQRVVFSILKVAHVFANSRSAQMVKFGVLLVVTVSVRL